MRLLAFAVDSAVAQGKPGWVSHVRGDPRRGDFSIMFEWSPGVGDTGQPLPNGRGRLSPAEAGRYASTAELVAEFDDFRRKHPTLNQKQAIAAFREERLAWARARGLCISAATMRAYRKRIDPLNPRFDRNRDGRGRRLGRQRRRRRASRGRRVS
jgi:hypothetical protein